MTDADAITLKSSGLTFSGLVAGPADGDVVVLVHGFPDTFRTWSAQMTALAGGGYRVVAPMLRGYEASSLTGAGTSSYHPFHAAQDIVGWAADLGGPRRVHLVGHDWGSVAAQIAVRMAPEQFASVTLIAVPPMYEVRGRLLRHPGQLVNSSYMALFQLRGLAESVVSRRDFAFVDALWRRWSPGWHWDPQHMASVKAALAGPGVLTAALSYYRSLASMRSEESRKVQALVREPWDVPVLALTGASDRCLDTRLFDDLDPSDGTRPSRFKHGLRTERLEGGHFVHAESPEATNELLLEWLGDRA